MALDKILIGARIRKIREKTFEESRKDFAIRCDLTERHIGQIERGDFVPSLKTLDKIISATCMSMDYVLYGRNKDPEVDISTTLANLINTKDNEELKMYYKCMSTIKHFYKKKN